jgi:NADH-quinone oxidoreductase subunit G
MSKLVTLTIDGKEVTVPVGTLVVDAAKKIGIDIPVFCYHPKMEPVGMCRMCLVEIGRPMYDRGTGEILKEADGAPKIQFGPKMETACTVQVSEGMVVIGMSDEVKAARNEIVEFILTSHPLDCPICDKGGECPLQNLTMSYGPGKSRFLYDDKIQMDKHVPLGDLIFLDRERCIQCGRCVRFQDEIAGDPVIGFFNRGRSLEIITWSEPGFDSYFSGNTTDICPVGALTTADFRFGARPWELGATASICPHCPVGCNITFNVRREAKADGDIVIKRVMPRQNEEVNEIWICDKGRFAYHYAEDPTRLKEPLVRGEGGLEPASWDDALELVANKIQIIGDELLMLGTGRLSNEDLFNLNQLASHVGGRAALYTHMAGGDLVAQVGVGEGTNFANLGEGSVILVVACDLEEEAPIWWLRVKQAVKRGATLIVANPRTTKADRYTTHIIRYEYGDETTTVLAMANALSTKRPDIGETAPGDAALRESIKTAALLFSEAENSIAIYGSEGVGLDASQSLSQACANLLMVTGHSGKANNGLIAVWPRANDQGAWDIGLRPIGDLQAVINDSSALYVVAADPIGDDYSLVEAFQSAEFVVVQDLYLTETAKLADVVLPPQSFIEREGTYTSGERRVQRFYPAVPSRPGTRPDYAIIGEISKRMGFEAESRVPARVLAQISDQLADYAGINYRVLAQVTEQWPIIGRGDLYYGGTAYENKQGLGVQLTPASQRGEAVPLSWPELLDTKFSVPEGDLLAVPFTRLYDRGRAVSMSKLLQTRIPNPYILTHPDSIKGAMQGAQMLLDLNGEEYLVEAHLDATLPTNVVLVPRSMGIQLSDPSAASLKNVEVVLAE